MGRQQDLVPSSTKTPLHRLHVKFLPQDHRNREWSRECQSPGSMHRSQTPSDCYEGIGLLCDPSVFFKVDLVLEVRIWDDLLHCSGNPRVKPLEDLLNFPKPIATS